MVSERLDFSVFGYKVCQEIRAKFLPGELPIIMITAKNQVSDLIEGFSSGANDYLAKPFSKDELLARIRTHLNLMQINPEDKTAKLYLERSAKFMVEGVPDEWQRIEVMESK